MTTNDVLQKEVELFQQNVNKIEQRFEEFRTESLQLMTKYLDGFNNILENQSDNRIYAKQIQEESVKLREKLAIFGVYIKQLHDLKAIDSLHQFKEIDKQLMSVKLNEFIATTNSKLKFLTACAYIFAVGLLGLLSTILSNMFNNGQSPIK